MRIFLTGATGFIGSHLAEALHAKGHHLRCLVRRTSNLQWIKHLPIEYVYGDLFDHDLLLHAVEDVDYVYHVAGVTKAKTREGYVRGNQIATKNLLDAVLLAKPALRRFVHVSSQAAVGPSDEGVPVDEDTPFHPITTYGVSKMEAEKECLMLKESIPITIVRPPAVYGPRDTDVFEFFNAMNKGLHAMIGFNDKQVSLIHVTDLVGGIILAGELPQGEGRTYFIASEGSYTWKEVGALTSQVMGKRVLRVRIPEVAVYGIAAVAQFLSMFSKKPALLNLEKARDIVQDAWTCSIERARRELGFRETITLKRGILDTVAWYRQHHWL